MREMHPRAFEELVAELLSKEGLKVELTPLTRDGGRDIIVVSDTPFGRHLHLVECKRYSENNPIDVRLVRSLYGVVEAERATAGMLVTTTRFTPPAVEFIDSVKNRLSKKDYNDLAIWIKKHARER
jgi:restriction endonuclease Mrr